MDACGSEDRCREILEELRWPGGPRCPRCESAKLSRMYKRDQFDCDSCGYQFSVKAGTIFHDSHLPLRKWFVAVYLITESRKGISAMQLKRVLGIGSYKTAWYLCHRIRAAMVEASPALLSGIAETLETCLSGMPRHPAPTMKEAARRRNKTVVLGAIERGGNLRLQTVAHNRNGDVMTFLTSSVADKPNAICTDEFRSYDQVGDQNTVHASVDHRAQEYGQGEVHTNSIASVWSLLDQAITASYHQLSTKHLPAYLQEFEWRFNNRVNPYLFRDTLMRLVRAEPLPYKELIA